MFPGSLVVVVAAAAEAAVAVATAVAISPPISPFELGGRPKMALMVS